MAWKGWLRFADCHGGAGAIPSTGIHSKFLDEEFILIRGLLKTTKMISENLLNLRLSAFY